MIRLDDIYYTAVTPSEHTLVSMLDAMLFVNPSAVVQRGRDQVVQGIRQRAVGDLRPDPTDAEIDAMAMGAALADLDEVA